MPDSNYLLLCSKLCWLIIASLSAAVPQSYEVQQPPEDSISSLSFSPNTNYIVASSWNNAIRCWEVQDNANTIARAEPLWTCTGLLLGGCEYWGRRGRGMEHIIDNQTYIYLWVYDTCTCLYLICITVLQKVYSEPVPAVSMFVTLININSNDQRCKTVIVKKWSKFYSHNQAFERFFFESIKIIAHVTHPYM